MPSHIVCRLLCLVVLLAPPVMARTMNQHDTAVLRLLDKVTARVEQVELGVGKTYQFGSLKVELRSCQQTPAEEEPESTALLVAWAMEPETREEIMIFRGWMFASNPALSALEHPVYDAWVISCKNPVNAAANAASAPGVESDAAPVVKTPLPSEGLPVAVPGYVPPLQNAGEAEENTEQ